MTSTHYTTQNVTELTMPPQHSRSPEDLFTNAIYALDRHEYDYATACAVTGILSMLIGTAKAFLPEGAIPK